MPIFTVTIIGKVDDPDIKAKDIILTFWTYWLFVEVQENAQVSE